MFRNFFAAGQPQYLVAGLGNPGKQYENTRHNVGFIAVDSVASALNADVKRVRFEALCGTAIIGETPVLLLKPQTFMNLSGNALRAAADYYRIPPEKVVVICDDTALPVGAVRIRPNGSAGGHNGLKSIIESLGSENFTRIRMGIGQKPEGWDLADYVLGKLTQSDRKAIDADLPDLVPALELIVKGNVQLAMSRYNKPHKERTGNENNT